MAGTSRYSVTLASYPGNGTFGELLQWHLAWGTKRGCSTTEPNTNKPWVKSLFAAFVNEEGLDPESAKRSLRNWTNKGVLPEEHDQDKVDRIYRELFSDDPNLKAWKADLERALELGRKHQAARIAKRNKADITAARPIPRPTAHFVGPDDPGASILSAGMARKHMAAAARENVALIVSRLTEFFAGRSSDLAIIDQFVNDRMTGGGQGLLVITAPPGFGKSALAAHWCSQAAHAPNRQIASHFCATAAGAATTALENIYANLHQQVAAILHEPIDQSNSFDTLVALLGNSPPDGGELIIWLDGIDEAQGKVECFLPRQLGERVCVIVSARADNDVIPAYLSPWLEDAMAVAHLPVRRNVEKLPLIDVMALVTGLFAKNGLIEPLGLAWRIFQASDEGYALFARNMTESAVEAVNEGREIDLGEAPESLRGYAKRELGQLATLDQWPDLQPLFALLTIAREAIRTNEVPVLLGSSNKRILPEFFPLSLKRWLSIAQPSDRQSPPLLSFAHPLLAEVFGQALDYQRKGALDDLCDIMMAQPFAQWPRYAWHHLPEHLLQSGRLAEASELLTNTDFIEARFAAVGGQEGPRLMAADWMSWCEVAKEQGIAPDGDNQMRHVRLWNDNVVRLVHAALCGIDAAWRQLMHDAGHASPAPHAGLIRPQPKTLLMSERDSRSFDHYVSGALTPADNMWVKGALALSDGTGFLSWGDDGNLKLWDSCGELKRVMSGHEKTVVGALQLSDDAGFLSWSDDGTLRLWGPKGERGAVMSAQKYGLIGALEIENGAGFLSWGWDDDDSLMLWGPNGERRAVMVGHESTIIGALALPDGAGYLSWSADCSLQRWGPDGEPGPIFRGHEAAVQGALALKNDAGFLSWGDDYTLRFWGPGGEPGAVLRHEARIDGALALPDSAGFLSWSDDYTVRLWGPNGEPGAVLPGFAGIPMNDKAGFLSWGESTIRLWGPAGEPGIEVRAHENFVDGALPLANDAGFLSWGRDGVMRYGVMQGGRDGALCLWDKNGQLRNAWLTPSGYIFHVEPLRDEDRYLVVFNGNVGIVHLARC